MKHETQQKIARTYPDLVDADRCTYEPAKYQDMWKSATFALDTSILLGLYKLHSDTTIEIMRTFRQLAAEYRLFIPYQVGVEFLRNRKDVIRTKNEHLSEALDILNNKYQEFLKHDKSKATDIVRHVEIIGDRVKAVLDEERRANAEFQELVKKADNDHVLNFFADMIETCGNIEPNDHERRHAISDAWMRLALKMPPGYEDKMRVFGDVMIWNEIKNFGRARGKNIVLVSNDLKGDWICKLDGSGSAPQHCRHELMNEYRGHTTFLFNTMALTEFTRCFELTEQAVQEIQKVETLKEQMIQHKHRSALLELYQLDNDARFLELQLIDYRNNPAATTSNHMTWFLKCMNEFRFICRRAVRFIQLTFLPLGIHTEDATRFEKHFEAQMNECKLIASMEHGDVTNFIDHYVSSMERSLSFLFEKRKKFKALIDEHFGKVDDGTEKAVIVDGKSSD